MGFKFGRFPAWLGLLECIVGFRIKYLNWRAEKLIAQNRNCIIKGMIRLGEMWFFKFPWQCNRIGVCNKLKILWGLFNVLISGVLGKRTFLNSLWFYQTWCKKVNWIVVDYLHGCWSKALSCFKLQLTNFELFDLSKLKSGCNSLAP